MRSAILHIKDLKIAFKKRGCAAVRGIDIKLAEGETVALIGESGSGKSVTAQAVLRLLSQTDAAVSGEIVFRGENLLQMPPQEMLSIRGKKIGMIFQNPMTSLDPTMKIGDQMTEGILFHEKISRTEAKKRALELLSRVGIADPMMRIGQYPHQLSGGMRQRVMIAIALSCNPEILIADEPTTALDITVQAQILELLKEKQKESGLGILFITHDLGVAARISDRVYVMKDGLIMESGIVDEIFYNPKEKYTKDLLAAKNYFFLNIDNTNTKRLL